MEVSVITVFLLQHSYEINGEEETKIIGIYSSREKADSIVNEYKELPAFKDYPNDFFIDGYDIDMDNWKEGFVRID